MSSLSRSGWMVLLASSGVLVSGRVFGIFELYLVAVAGLALVLAAAVTVRRARVRLDVTRSITPPRVHAGIPSRVELEVRNKGPRSTATLSLRDPVGSGRSARVSLAPLRPGEGVRAAYALPSDRRGVLLVGPLTVELTDPFGLATTTAPAAPVAELTVWPRVDDVTPLPHTLGDDPHGGTDHPNAPSSGGEDFYALRPYVVGDDLRRVHWRSTARRDELVVRHDEVPWQGRATVLLDTRRGAHTPDTFERAVSAAASVVVACSRRRHLLRLVTTAGEDSGFAAGATHVDALMERLATVTLVEWGRLGGVVGRLRTGRSGGAMAALVGGRSPADLQVLAQVGPAFGHLTTVCFTTGHGELTGAPAGLGVVVVDEDHPFAPVWNTALAGGRGAAVGAR